MKTENQKSLSGNLAATLVTKLNYIKLIIRSIIFIGALTMYLLDKSLILDNIYLTDINAGAYLLFFTWILFAGEMVSRFFPSNHESMGCQKQFSINFVPNEKSLALIKIIKKKHLKSVIIVAVLWIALNIPVALLYFTGIIDEGILLVISLFFAVCDIVCILFYCPFQSIIMKNRCCVTCRIYNWDFLMMFTPLLLVKSYYTLSLFGLALLLFIKWELTNYQHPEWFYEETNEKLSCAACTEKLCFHKKSIQTHVTETKTL